MSATAMDLPEAYKTADRGPGLQAFVIVMIIITVFSILLRFMSRGLSPMHPGQNHTRFWLDDWTALAAVPFILTQHAIALVGVSRGFGRHAAVLEMSTVLYIARISWIVYFIYDAGLFLTKLSVLLFLRRVFPKNNSGSWFNYGLWAAHFMNVAWLVGIVFGTIFLCDPIEKSYNPSIPGQCGSTSSLYIGSAVPSVAIDLIILILPLPKLWNLHTDRGRKVGLIIVFMFGYCVIVMSLGRLITTLRTQQEINTDYSYAGITFVYWVAAEPTFSLLGICLPAMLPLGRHVMTTYFSPLASKVSLAFTPRRGSGGSSDGKNGDVSVSMTEYENHPRQVEEARDATNPSPIGWDPYLQGTASLDSQREMLRASPQHEQYSVAVPGRQHDQYTVDVRGGETWTDGTYTHVPTHTIRVDNDVRVT